MSISRKLMLTALLGAAALPVAAQAQDSWTGPYGGVQMSYSYQQGYGSERILFDTNLDGTYGDTVNSAPNVDAFAPGFCSGAAVGATPGDGCREDSDNFSGGAHLGYDYQVTDRVLVGVVADYNRIAQRDSVSGFSSTPASYTMSRTLRDLFTLRARAGAIAGKNLIYATGGIAMGRIDNKFATTNTANAFVGSGDDWGFGFAIGAGAERRITDKISVGVQYLYRDLDADDYTVRATRGTAPATNPFVTRNPDGTDFKRDNRRFESEALQVNASYRF